MEYYSHMTIEASYYLQQRKIWDYGVEHIPVSYT